MHIWANHLLIYKCANYNHCSKHFELQKVKKKWIKNSCFAIFKTNFAILAADSFGFGFAIKSVVKNSAGI